MKAIDDAKALQQRSERQLRLQSYAVTSLVDQIRRYEAGELHGEIVIRLPVVRGLIQKVSVNPEESMI